MTRGDNRIVRQRRTNQQLAILLLLLYIAGTSHLERLHSFSHDHELIVIHSEAQEEDPCHQFIYHNGIDEGCEHDTHLLASGKCEMCDLALLGDQTFVSVLVFGKTTFALVNFQSYKKSLDSYWAVISSSRAPPAVA